MKKIKASAWVVLTAVFVAGCSVKYKAVGKFDDYNEVLIGDVTGDPMTGTGYISGEAKNSGIKCDGRSHTTHKPPSLGCAGQRGTALLQCTDGREVTVNYVFQACSKGYGEGKDRNGVTFRFVFGLSGLSPN